MKQLLLALCLCVLLVGVVIANDSEGKVIGPNLLRDNPRISVYKESNHGIPTYIEGTLSASKSRAGAEFEATLEFFENNKAAFKMSAPAEEIALREIQADDLDMRHVKVSQIYQGIPVIGGELIAHFNSESILQTVNGKYYHDINIDINIVVSEGEAINIAYDDLKSFFGTCEPSDPELVIFPWEDNYYLAWRMFLYSNSPMGRWEYFIDAENGNIIFNANRIMNENDIGTGLGVLGGTRDHIDTRHNGSVYEMRDYTRRADNNPHGHDGQMPTNGYIQTNLATSSLPGSVATDADNYWDDVNLQRPAVDGHVYTALVYDYLLSHLGRNSYDDNGANMLTSVNYSAEGDNNAYWNGSQIVIWSWSTGWRSLSGCPDVIAHEWGHAVTETTSGLVYQKESGALNESFSDMIGAAFEFAYPDYDTPDWGMGENGRTTGVPFRDMENPHNYSDPDFYGTSDTYWIDVEGCTPSYLNDYCGVHTNSGVGNKWFFLLSDGGTHHDVTVTGIGVQNAILIAYRANLSYWTSSTDYHQAALGTISAANDLDGTGQWALQVSNAWNAVGVSTPGPTFDFAFPDGTPSVLVPDIDNTFEVLITSVLGGVLVSGSPQIHYSINGGTLISDALTQITSTRFRATLPGDTCGSRFTYYISAEETSTGLKYDISPSTPHFAIAAASTSTVFEDNFQTSTGWTVSGDATDGQWNRGVPAGGGERGDPPSDFDGSGYCYLTDNVSGNSDVDGGTTNLISPTFDLSGGDARISYARWYSNNFGGDPYNDVMRVYLSNNNGANWSLVETIGPSNQAAGGWYDYSFYASDIITSLTAQMMVKFEVSDLGDGSVVEAGVDAFLVTQFMCSPAELDIITTSVPDWTAGVSYSEQLAASGGSGIKAWSDKNNDLIGTGLSLSTTGLLSGLPLNPDIISFTALVEDEDSNTDEQPITFTVNSALAITTSSLPEWTAGVPYSQQLSGTGGTGTVTWTDKLNNLNGTGLSLSASGLVNGTPSSSGELNFTALMTDAVGGTAEQALTISVNDAILITSTDTLAEATVGHPYAEQLASTGGTGAIGWTDNDNGLNASGVTLSASGELMGTPTTEGLISFTARAADAIGGYGDKLLIVPVVLGYMCGDANGSGAVDIGDAVYIVNYVFRGGPAPDPLESGDANCDGEANVADAVYIINYVFKGGPIPCCP
ncbi:MAG: M4 family metallopeptidase [candidate division Zixibacteria bacterium]|nr:M4 family metallopeptidase [candidate division Zixibacteria bacterium]